MGVAACAAIEIAPAGQDGSTAKCLHEARLAPLERMPLPHALVRARRDLDAVRAYLAGFAGSTSTQRAYRREIECLLPWTVA